MSPDDPIAHVAIDIEGRFLEFDAGAEHVFGHRADQVIGQPMAQIIVPEPLRQWHNAGMQRYLETGEEFLVGRTVHIIALHADGSDFPIEISITKRSDDPVVFAATITRVADSTEGSQ